MIFNIMTMIEIMYIFMITSTSSAIIIIIIMITITTTTVITSTTLMQGIKENVRRTLFMITKSNQR